MAKRRKRARHKVRAHRRKGTTVKTHMSYEEAPRRRRRGKRRRRARAAEAPKRRKRRRGRKGKHRVRGYSYKRRGKRVRVRGHMSREEAPRRRRRKRRRARAAEAPRKRRRKGRRRRRARENYAMAPRKRRRGRRRRRARSNPDGKTLAVGFAVGTLGFLGADALDRFLATRADAALMKVPEAAGVRTDVPIYRDLPRLGAGVAVAAVPIIGAAFMGRGMFRDALQFFGFGAAMSTLGKAANGAIAYLLKDNNYGMRMYGTVQAADQLQSQALAGLPVPYGTSGLPLWLEGLGSCCRGGPNLEQHKLQPPGGGLPPSRAEQVQPPTGMYPPVSTPPQVPTYPQQPPPVVTRQPTNGGQPPPPPAIQIPGTPPFVPPTTVPGGGPTVVAVPPTPPPMTALPPVAAFFPAAGVGPAGFPSLRGLGADVRRQLQPALDAISANRDAFAAVQAGNATSEQQERATQVVQRFAPQIRTLQGLSGLPNGGRERHNPYRWGQDKNDAAE